MRRLPCATTTHPRSFVTSPPPRSGWNQAHRSDSAFLVTLFSSATVALRYDYPARAPTTVCALLDRSTFRLASGRPVEGPARGVSDLTPGLRRKSPTSPKGSHYPTVRAALVQGPSHGGRGRLVVGGPAIPGVAGVEGQGSYEGLLCCRQRRRNHQHCNDNREQRSCLHQSLSPGGPARGPARGSRLCLSSSPGGAACLSAARCPAQNLPVPDLPPDKPVNPCRPAPSVRVDRQDSSGPIANHNRSP